MSKLILVRSVLEFIALSEENNESAWWILHHLEQALRNIKTGGFWIVTGPQRILHDGADRDRVGRKVEVDELLAFLDARQFSDEERTLRRLKDRLREADRLIVIEVPEVRREVRVVVRRDRADDVVYHVAKAVDSILRLF